MAQTSYTILRFERIGEEAVYTQTGTAEATSARSALYAYLKDRADGHAVASSAYAVVPTRNLNVFTAESVPSVQLRITPDA